MGDDLEELMVFARNEVEGPTLIAPMPPEPYHTCTGCRYFSKSMASTGGMRGSPTYFKDCIHQDVHTELRKGRSLNSEHGFHGSSINKEVTPDWCPFLNDKLDKDK